MQLNLIREYSTPAYIDKSGPRYVTSVPTVNPDTGIPYTKDEYNSKLLANLRPVSPWFSIELVNGDKDIYICPDYANYVGHNPVVYIYRLKSDYSISYIGSAIDGMLRVSGHRYSCKDYRLTHIAKSGGTKFYSAVLLHG